MPAPTTPILDSFNAGANQALSTRAGWHSTRLWSGDAELSTDSVPTYATGSATADNAWGSSFSADQEVYIFIKTTGKPTLYVRQAAPTNTAPSQGYGLIVGNSGVPAKWEIWDYTFSVLYATATQATAAGDGIWFSAVGNVLTGYYSASGSGTWSSVITYTDPSWPGGGYIAMDFDIGTPIQIDSFGGGSIVTAATTPIRAAIPFTQGAGGGAMSGGPH